MTLVIEPIGAKVVANGNGNKTTLGGAKNVYICATADDLITNVTKGTSFQMHQDQVIVLHKDSTDEIHAGTTGTHFTPIGYTRG